MPRNNLNLPATVVDGPVLGPLLRYWQEKRGGGAMPARAVIDPLEMGPRLLPNLLLCDLFDRGTRVRFRLVGTTVVKRFGYDPTGRYLGEAMRGGYVDHLAALHRLLYCERAPLCSASVFRWGAKRRLEAKHLLLPLTNGGPDPAIALLGIAFISDEVFPPPLRSLDGDASHGAVERAAMSAAAAHDWQRVSGRNVA